MEPDLDQVLNGTASAPPPASQPPPLSGNDADLLARAAVAEGDPTPESWQNVAGVALNRAQASGRTVAQVLSDPGQFEAYQNGSIQAVDPQSAQYRAALAAIAPVLSGSVRVPYDSFFSPSVLKARGQLVPAWGESGGTPIGSQMFFAGKYASPASSEPDLEQVLNGAPSGAPAPAASPSSPGVSPAAPVPTAPAAPVVSGTPGKGDYSVQYSDNRDPTPAPLAAGVRAYAEAHGLNPNATPGTADKPYILREGGAAAPEGTYYFDLNGQLHSPDVPGSIGAGLAQGGAEVVNSLTAPIIQGAGALSDWENSFLPKSMQDAYAPGQSPSDVVASQQARTADYNQLLGQSPYATGGRIAGNIALSAPILTAGGEVGSGLLRAARLPQVAAFLGGAGGTNLLTRGASLAASGSLQAGGAAALTGQPVVPAMTAGGVLGPIAGMVGAGVGAGLNKLAGSTGGAVATPVETRVGNALLRAFSRDGVDPDAAIAAAQANPLAPAFHAGGPNVAGLAEVAAKTPGEAQTIITNAVLAHQAQVPGQIKEAIGSALGGKGDFLDTLNAQMASRRASASANMRAIADQPVTLNDNSIQAIRSPLAQPAIQDAAKILTSSIDPTERANGAALMNLTNTALDHPAVATMTIRNAQDVSKALNVAADSAYGAPGGYARGAALKGLANAIRDNASDPLDGGSQRYADWLEKYGDDSTNIDALNLGHGVFSSAGDNTAPYVGEKLAKMGDAAQDYYRKGVAEALIDQSQTGRGGVGTMRQLLRTPDIQAKVRLAFPDDDSYNDFVSSAQQRVQEQNLNNRIMGGSPTYPLAAARTDLEAQPFHPLDATGHVLDIGGNILTGNFGAVAGKAAKLGAASIPRADRSLLGNPQTNALLGGALTDPDVMENLLTKVRAPPVAGKFKVPSAALVAPATIGVNRLLSPQPSGASQ